MSNTPARVLRSQGLALAIRTATGESPLVSDYSEYAELTFNPEQVKRLRAKLKDTLSASPGDVRVDIAPVVVPVVLEKVLPLALVALVGAYVLGRYKVII